MGWDTQQQQLQGDLFLDNIYCAEGFGHRTPLCLLQGNKEIPAAVSEVGNLINRLVFLNEQMPLDRGRDRGLGAALR